MSYQSYFRYTTGGDFTFEPRKTHRYVVISETSSGITVVDEEKTDTEIADCCSTSQPDGENLWSSHYIVTLLPDSDDLSCIPFSRETFDAIQMHWHIPDLCFSGRKLDVNLTFVTPVKDGDWIGFRMNTYRQFQHNQIVVQNKKTSTTYTLLCTGSWYVADRFLSEILRLRDYAHEPSILAFTLAHYNMDVLASHQREDFDKVRAIEQVLRCGQYVRNTVLRTDLEPDITEMPRDLTTLTGALALQTRVLNDQLSLMKFVGSVLNMPPRQRDTPVLIELGEHLQYMERDCENRLLDVQGRKETVQAMVQMVYAILQQRDNDISHHYGADMRIITIITLIFLPGTFVATFFSTSFWDFGPDNTGVRLSGWVWLYFVATAVLTLFVLSAWQGFGNLNQTRKQIWFWLGRVRRDWRTLPGRTPRTVGRAPNYDWAMRESARTSDGGSSSRRSSVRGRGLDGALR